MSYGDGIREVLKVVSMKWLVEEIRVTNKLIHDSEQLLRGVPSDKHVELREAVRSNKEDVRLMVEELERRKAEPK